MKVKLIHFLAPAALIFLSPIYSWTLKPVSEEIPQIALFRGELGSSLDALVFLSITFTSGVFLSLLLKKSLRALKTLFSLSAIYLITFTLLFYVDAALSSLGFSSNTLLLLVLIALLALSATPLYLNKFSTLYSSLLLLSMSGLGCLLNNALRLTTKIILLILYSLFDVYSVYKGFLREAFSPNGGSRRVDAFTPFLVKLNSLCIGSGDIVFYSLTLSLSIELGLISYLVTSICIVAGYSISLWLLSERRAIPGLPLPILLSLTYLIPRIYLTA